MKRRTSKLKQVNAPLHVKKKGVSIHLSKELKESLKIKRRNVVVKKGDKVKILRGKYKGKEGSVIRVSYKHQRVYVEGIAKQNSRGVEKAIPLHPSNLTITELKLDEKRREKLGIEEG